MRLHIMDDEKVIDRTIDYFEAVFPHENKYVVLLPQKVEKLKYIKNTRRVEICKYKSKEWFNVVKSINEYSEVIVHYLNPIKVRFINSIKHNKITWIIWGSDLYQGLLANRGYRQYYDNYILSKSMMISKIRQKFPIVANLLDNIRLKKRIKAISKISRVAAIEPDYKLLLNYFPELSHLKKYDFFYYPIDSIIGDTLKNKRCTGSRIMLGNSASPTGNHEYALQLLKNKEIHNEIIIPLSYGPINYKNFVINKIKEYKPLTITILSEFLPLEKYNEMLLSCSNFVYANFRQEALGNIVIALYLGGKIFLDKKNPLYEYLKQLGLIIYSLEEINSENIKKPLSDKDYVKNREIVFSLYNYNKLLSTIYDTFKD